MNKAKCVNGHFFDLDRFHACPFCGGDFVGNAENGKFSRKSVSVQQKAIVDEDKTTLLENSENIPTRGEAGGIVWRFSQTSQKTEEKKLTEKTGKNAEKSAGERKLADTHMEQPAQQNSSTKAEKPAESALSQAVAATGYRVPSALPKTVAYFDTPEVEIPVGWLVCTEGVYRGNAFVCRTGKNRIGRNPDCNINLVNELSISREPHAIIIYDPKGRKFYLQSGDGSGLVYHNRELLFGHVELKGYDSIQMGSADFIFIPLCGERFTWDDYLN